MRLPLDLILLDEATAFARAMRWAKVSVMMPLHIPAARAAFPGRAILVLPSQLFACLSPFLPRCRQDTPLCMWRLAVTMPQSLPSFSQPLGWTHWRRIR